MWKKQAVALTAALALTLSGCAGKGADKIELPVTPAAINIQLGGEPQTLDPAFAQTPQEESYLLHLLEGLTTLGDRLEALPAAASGWELVQTEGGENAYKFTIDPNAKWSDGQAVSAQDFIYAWKRTLNPDTKSPVAYKLYPIRGAKAVNLESADPETLGVSVTETGELLVELEGPCDDLLQRMASPVWAPLRESAVKTKTNGWFYDAEKYLTNGPYTMAQWERDQFIAMERNKHYRDKGAVKAPKLNFVLVQEQQSLMNSLRDGSIQLAVDLPQIDLEAMAPGDASNAILGSYLLVFNTRQPPLDDVRVRQALSQGLDRQAIAKVMQDGSVAARGLVPGGAVVEGVDLRKKAGEVVESTANTQQAEKLLAEAGYPKGEGLTIRYLVNDEPAHLRVAQELQRQWQALGITMEIDQKSWNDYQADQEDGQFEITRLSVFSDQLYPSVFFDGWVSDSPLNYTGYQNHAYDICIDQSNGLPPRPMPAAEGTAEGEAAGEDQGDKAQAVEAAASTPTEESPDGQQPQEETLQTAVDCLVEAERLLVNQDAVVAPLTWYTNRYMVAQGFSGWKGYPTGTMYFGQAVYQRPAAVK